jgi:tetratricopeptide (TPR) repeat protein
LRLADLGRLLSPLSPEPHLDRAVQIAPTNPRYQLLVGLQKLEACDFDESRESFAAGLEHLRRALELDANATRVLEPLVLQKTVLGLEVDGLDPVRYARGLLLDRPDLLLDFVARNPEIKSQPEVRLQLLRESKERLAGRERAFNYSLVETWALGRIEMELGNWQAAREQFDMLLQLNYNHTAARYQRVLALTELREWGPAEEEIRSLLEANPGNTTYQRALQRIQESRLQGP